MNIENVKNHAHIAESSYADFTKVETKKQFETALSDLGFSKDQTSEFSNNWRLIDHQPNTSSGFSATLFKSKHTPTEYIFANRNIAASDIPAIHHKYREQSRVMGVYI